MNRSKRHKGQLPDRPKRQKKKCVPSGLESLPEGALFAIAEHLAQVEPGGVRGPSLASRDLCGLGLACKALRSCAQHGIQQLAQQVLHKLQQSTPPDTTLPRLPPTDAAVAAAAAEAIKAAAAANENAPDNAQADAIDVILNDYLGTVVPALEPQTSWQYWEDFLEALAAGNCSSITDLQQKAQWLGIFPASDLSQDQLEDAVWAAFGLATATSKVPAVLLVACRRERHSEAIHADGPDGCAALHAALKRLAELAREMRLPLGLQAQRWGYGGRPAGQATQCCQPTKKEWLMRCQVA